MDVKFVNANKGANRLSKIQKFYNAQLILARKRAEDKAYTFLRYIKEVIKDQKGLKEDWQPLSPNYLAFKASKGWDMGMLQATHDYINNIIVISPRKNEWVVTVREIQHKLGKISLPVLANALEYGTDIVPARPHWRPAWQRFLKNWRMIKYATVGKGK